MDAAEFQTIATELGACEVEQLYELACARYDLRRLPGTAHGRDEYEIAADAVTASRALPRPKLEEIKFPRSSWTPAGVRWPAGWDEPPRDETLEWWERHRAAQEATDRFSPALAAGQTSSTPPLRQSWT